MWKVESIIMGLLSFMLTEENSIASIHLTPAERKKFAKASLDWNFTKNKTGRFELIFAKNFNKKGVIEIKKVVPAKKIEETKSKEEEKKAPAKKGAKAAIVEEPPKLNKRGSSKKEEIIQPKAVPDQKKRVAKEEEKKDKKVNKPLGITKPEDNFIYIQCVKVGPKIRLRIANSTSYNNNWNC